MQLKQFYLAVNSVFKFFQKLRKYPSAFGRIKNIFYFDMRSVVQSKMIHTCRKSELIQTFYLVLNSEVRDN